MNTIQPNNKGYVIVALLAAVVGGLAMLLVTNAVPRMMKRMMTGMMENMRAQMLAEGCNPEEM